MKYLLLIASFLHSQYVFSQDLETQNRIDSLIRIIDNSTNLNDTILAKAYLQLSEELYVSDPDTVIYLCEKVTLITTSGLSSNPSEKVKRSLLISKAGALNNIGAIYFNEGDIVNALEYFHQSLKVEEQIGNKDGIGTSLNNLGYIYLQHGDDEQALKYFNQALDLRIEINYKEGIASTLNNIGLVYYGQDDITKTLEYFKKSLLIEEEIGNQQGLASGYANMAALYKKQGNVEKAIQQYKKALSISEELNNRRHQTLVLHNIGIIFYNEDNLVRAKEYALKSMELAKDSGYPKNISDASSLLSKIYEKQGKGNKALEMYKVFITMRDSLNNTAAQNAIIEQKLQYEFDKKEALAAVEFEKEIAITTAEKNKQTVIIWGVSIGLILIITFAVIIWNRLRITNSQKQVIQNKNKENELLLGEIHHRVKNNLQVISSLLSLQERNITDETAKAAILDGKERVQSMGLIHKMLYQQNNFSGINMSEYIEKLISGLLDSFGKSSDDFELNYNIKDINLDVDTAIPLGLIINELVVNALKHAYAKTNEPRVNINLQEVNNQLVLQVEDNGTGEVNDVQSSESFGMKLVNSLSRQLSGTIDLEQRDGLRFKIAINDYKLIA